MSPDKITDARSKYAGFSLSDLASKEFKVPDLRKIAREVGVRKIIQGGKEVSPNVGRKQELSVAIYEACEAYREQEVKEEVKEESTLSEVEKISEYRDSYEEMDELTKYFYYGEFNQTSKKWDFMGLRECAILMENDPFLNEFMVLIASVRPTVERLVKDKSKTGDLSINTLSNVRSNLLKRIEKLVDSDEKSLKEVLTKAYSRFYSAVMATFKSVQSQKAATSNVNLNKRQNNAIDVKVSNLVNWAKDTVINLPESPSMWREVAIAVMVLTGRRQSEVMATAKFDPAGSETLLMFSGQLKKHTDEAVGAFEIPILGNCASAVLQAMQWLEANGKRCLPIDDSDEAQAKAAKAAHDRFSRYLSEKAKSVCDMYIQPVEGASLVKPDESGKLKDRRNCHLMRQVYGQLVIPLFHPSVQGVRRKSSQILTEIMGHSNRESSIKHAATAYDTDIFIVDVDDVKQMR